MPMIMLKINILGKQDMLMDMIYLETEIQDIDQMDIVMII